MVTQVALKLFISVFNATKVGDPTLSEMVSLALSSFTQMHLIATMIFYQLCFFFLEPTELALKLVHSTVLQEMIMHVLFNDAITVTLDATTTFILMLFILIIDHLFLASQGSKRAIEFDGLQKSKKLLIACEGSHLRVLSDTGRASVLILYKPFINALFAEHRYLTSHAILRISRHEWEFLTDHASCEVVVIFDFIDVNNQLLILKLLFLVSLCSTTHILTVLRLTIVIPAIHS